MREARRTTPPPPAGRRATGRRSRSATAPSDRDLPNRADRSSEGSSAAANAPLMGDAAYKPEGARPIAIFCGNSNTTAKGAQRSEETQPLDQSCLDIFAPESLQQARRQSPCCQRWGEARAGTLP